MEKWQRETEHYRDRVSCLCEVMRGLTSSFQRLPSSPLSFEPTEICAVKYQLCILTIGAARSAQELQSSINLLWIAGRFLAASVCVRVLIELWGLLAYADSKILKKLDEPEGIDSASERVKRLLLGSKSGVPFPTGIKSTLPPVNAMEFVRAAERLSPGIQDTYGFLCDASHPSYSQHSYLLFSGSEYDNWSNKRFAKHANAILERTVSAAEISTQGITDLGILIFDGCLPQILIEATKARSSR
jgi:hypothetical protein